MRWQVTVQDGSVYINTGDETVEVTPRLLRGRTA
jgi:uncharacterized protein YaeQ